MPIYHVSYYTERFEVYRFEADNPKDADDNAILDGEPLDDHCETVHIEMHDVHEEPPGVPPEECPLCQGRT
jgi:hypothetical protein